MKPVRHGKFDQIPKCSGADPQAKSAATSLGPLALGRGGIVAQRKENYQVVGCFNLVGGLQEVPRSFRQSGQR